VQYPVQDYFDIEDNCYNYSDANSDNSIRSGIITSGKCGNSGFFLGESL